ncbi:MAG TPA: polysaccharide biosynthesis protein [Pyrinomonadaceae bacterium]
MEKSVLITGGAGFLGRCLGLALKDHYNVTLAGRNNFQNQEAKRLTGCQTLPLDVSNIESVRDCFVEIKPHIVIHAAATKYVDLSERYPMECLDVNVLGSQNVARVAAERGVEVVVGMSTDKAAPPVSNTYGLTKALMERLFCAMNGKTETRFACVRHGNIAWSTGSVFPAWKQMHDSTGVIGSTGPEMTRFFSKVDDAVELIKTALENIEGLQGTVLTRALKSAQIRDILEIWIKHKGGSWKQIEGRPGERPHEYLIGEPELPFTYETKFKGMKHYVINFNQRAPKPLPAPSNSENAERLSEEEILEIINNPPVELR